MTEKPYSVLFLCTGNSARSIIAEALLNRDGNGRFKAWSAGSQPKGHVHPFTLDLLHSLSIDTGFARSKSWDEFAGVDASAFDFIFTVCDSAANETCPIWPGHPMTAHWGVPDPAAVEGTDAERHFAFAEAARQLGNRISLLLSLPIASLERMALLSRLDTIGQTKD
ncbi:arsenate reductase ArsC [Pelagibacterium sp.]|uniref:arsenate reductase ArsC n=1 Tax=Pelagibacterium sp. TaxID=1967288 RepID=UPI003A929162